VGRGWTSFLHRHIHAPPQTWPLAIHPSQNINVDAPPPPAAPAVPAPAAPAPTTALPPVPVTLVTGFLGAGKSTLVNHILTADHGLRIAVILNELGAEAGIERPALDAGRRGDENDEEEALDAAALVPVEEWVELANGCLCCSAKSGFLAALEALLAKRGAEDSSSPSSSRPIDYVLVETTGLADPGPAAAALWADDALESAARIDGVVVVADARRVVAQLSEARAPGAVNEAARQLAYADVVLLNKTDLVSDPAELAAVEAAVAGVAPPGTPIHHTVRSSLDPALLLHRGTLDPGAAARAAALAARLPATVHDAGIGSVAWRVAHEEVGDSGGGAGAMSTDAAAPPSPPLSVRALRAWLDGLLWERGGARLEDVYRMKGVVCAAPAEVGGGEAGGGRGGGGGESAPPSTAATTIPRRLILQAVHELYDLVDAGPWPAGEARESRFVAIGRGLGRVEASFRAEVVDGGGGVAGVRAVL
jgi:G3E family GTPase